MVFFRPQPFCRFFIVSVSLIVPIAALADTIMKQPMAHVAMAHHTATMDREAMADRKALMMDREAMRMERKATKEHSAAMLHRAMIMERAAILMEHKAVMEEHEALVMNPRSAY